MNPDPEDNKSIQPDSDKGFSGHKIVFYKICFKFPPNFLYFFCSPKREENITYKIKEIEKSTKKTFKKISDCD